MEEFEMTKEEFEKVIQKLTEISVKMETIREMRAHDLLSANEKLRQYAGIEGQLCGYIDHLKFKLDYSSLYKIT